MKWYKPKNEIDEHDLPTEPMQYSPQEPTMPAGTGRQTQLVLPPIPEEPKVVAPIKPWWEKNRPVPEEPRVAAPEKPRWEKNRPAQEEQAKERKSGQPEGRPTRTNRATPRGRRRPSVLPSLVRSFGFIAQLILAARIVVDIMQAVQQLPNNADWARIVTVLSDLLMQPLYFLVRQIQLSFTINEYVYILLAILFYGILTRIVAGFLKVALGMR